MRFAIIIKIINQSLNNFFIGRRFGYVFRKRIDNYKNIFLK